VGVGVGVAGALVGLGVGVEVGVGVGVETSVAAVVEAAVVIPVDPAEVTEVSGGSVFRVITKMSTAQAIADTRHIDKAITAILYLFISKPPHMDRSNIGVYNRYVKTV
jgi:hypothetical protein